MRTRGAAARRRRRAVVGSILAALWGSLGGCYRYSPPAVAPAVGERVRVELTDRGTADLASLAGQGIAAVEGRLLSADDSALTLAVAVVERRDGLESDWAGERLAIPRADAAGISTRTLSRPRSALLAGAIVTGAMLAAKGLSGQFGGGTPGSGQHTGPR